MKELITNAKHHCLKLQTNGIIRFATVSEIVYLKAKDNYTCFVLEDLSQFTVCKTLQNFETVLGHLFYRCHKTYLVNSIYIKEINTRNRQILLTTGEKIPFSRNKTKILEEKMKIKTVLDFQM
jgi:DNA-binding LytR/AlgR family response regulator